MAVTITENIDSRAATDAVDSTATLTYTVRGTADESVVRAQVDAAAPASYLSLVVDSISLEPVWIDTVTESGVWTVTVNYVRDKGDSQRTFDTGGGTAHITQSLETVATAGQVAPDLKGAIGVNGDNVSGTDITIPVFNFTETHKIPLASVTLAYAKTLAGLTGTVNDAAFKGFAKGEVLFMGASGSQKGADDWEITFSFAASPHTTVSFDDDYLADIEKGGWEYLWVRFADDEDENQLIKKPQSVYVERVYEYGDFSGLGIGTT